MILTIDAIKSAYLPYHDDDNSQQMSKYMRNQFPFLGIKKSTSAPINRELFKSFELPTGEALKLLVQNLFLEPEREYHYIAMRILDKQKRTLTIDDLCFIESLILQNSWWDSIDDISPNVVGYIVRQNKAVGEAHMMRWVESDNFWLQRAGLLHQLKFKQEMNTALLTEMIDKLKGEKEFFIQKAIGWILREYSKTDAQFVIDFVAEKNLAPLSSREALKWYNNKSTLV